MALSRTVSGSVTRMARDARFVFTGIVQQQAASALSLIPAGPETAVVRVDHIHRAAPALRSQVGQRVTLMSAPGAALRAAHQRLVFFTNPVLYGETVGVREIGHLEAPDDLDAINELIGRATEEDRMSELRRHLASADAVVQGKVVGLRHVSETTAATASEHDPDWWVAEIRVTRALKGEHRGELAVRFPASRDVRWFAAPKPKDGDEGVFLLHRDGLHVGGAHLALLHADDLLAADAAELRRIAESL